MHSETPVEVYTGGINIKKIACGWHHTLVLDEDGKIYHFGAKLSG